MSAQDEIIKNVLIERPHLADLEQLVEKMKYGKLTVVFTVFNGGVQSMEVLARQLIRYDKNEKLTRGL